MTVSSVSDVSVREEGQWDVPPPAPTYWFSCRRLRQMTYAFVAVHNKDGRLREICHFRAAIFPPTLMAATGQPNGQRVQPAVTISSHSPRLHTLHSIKHGLFSSLQLSNCPPICASISPPVRQFLSPSVVRCLFLIRSVVNQPDYTRSHSRVMIV